MTLSRSHRHEITGIALAVLAAIAFGTLAISAKLAYRAGADPFPLLAARFALAALLLSAYHALRRRSLRVQKKLFIRLLLGGGLLYGFEATLFFAALQRASAAVVALVFYSYPIWTTLLSFLTKLERFRWSTLAALLLGGTGVVLVFSLPSTSLAGPILAVSAALAVAIYFIFIQMLLRDVEPSVAAMWTSAGAAVALTVATIVTGQALPIAAFGPAFALALASAFAFVTLYEAITRIGSARSSIAAMLEPVTTIALAAIFLAENLSPRILLGGALIISVLPVLAVTGPRKDGVDLV